MKNLRVLTSTLFLFAIAIGFAQKPSRSKLMEKYGPSASKQLSQNRAAKTTTISKPVRSANYGWNNNWVFSDSSTYAYTPVGWLETETRKNANPLSRASYTYDNQYRLTNQLNETYNVILGLWLNSNRRTYVYDAHGNVTLDQYETFNGTNWVIQTAYQYIFSYDANDHLVDYISQNWNSTNQVWNDYHHQTGFQYDANGNCTQYEEQYKLGANWVNMDRFSYTYVNDIPSVVLIEHWTGTQYDNDDRWVNITWHSWDGVFSDQTAVTSYTLQNWTSNNWYDWTRVNVTYDSYGGSVEVDQDYNGSTWMNTYRYKTNYDNQFNYTGNSLEMWNATYWDYYSSDKIINTYDADFNFVQQIWQYYDFSSYQFINLEKRVYDGYEVFAGVAEQGPSALVSVFPNPCSDYFEIQFDQNTSLKNENLRVFLYDQTGKMVQQTPLDLSTSRIGISNLQPGLYTYDLSTKTQSLKRGKLVVQ